eukprot:TRINITY_DN21388_c0_g1_i1.p1 TRINITY_DN21388_c0_g1~~TRINITY_DN21388_c0_g1_i1.p1  ORF type:complete len:763 (+),score=304.49 TRINITY_DN21388_c0_g1_i1:99-2291(+)
MLRSSRAALVRAAPGQLKDALKRLFLKIHPDLCADRPEQMRANESALQDLNAILAWERQLRAGNAAAPPDARRVSFYDRHYDAPEGAPAPRGAPPAPGQPGVISAVLELPAELQREGQQGSLAQATLAVNLFLKNLLTSAGVLSDQDRATLAAVQRQAEARADGALAQAQRKAAAVAGEQAARRERLQRVDSADPAEIPIAEVVREPADPTWRRRQQMRRLQLRTDPMGDFGAAFDAADMEVPEGAHEAAEGWGRDPVTHATKVRVRSKGSDRKQRHRRDRPRQEQGRLNVLAEQFSRLMQEHWHPADVPEVTELIAADLLHYDRELSPVDCAQAVETLHRELRSMRYDLWYFVPLYVTAAFSAGGDIPGFISVPFDFDLSSFLTFLDTNRDEIRRMQEASFHRAREVAAAVARARQAVPLGDVVLRCPVSEALPALRLLAAPRSVELMRSGEWGGLIVEVIDAGSQYGARDSGVMQVPSDFTLEGLGEFCAMLLQTQMIKQLRSAYGDTVADLEELDKLLRVCYEVINPAAFDLESSGAPVGEKLQWVRELYSVSGMLSRFDWTEYTFVLGELSLDWDEGVLSLPANFHGANFAQTVQMLHEEDLRAVGDQEPTDKEALLLDLEARRIRSELQGSGLLELDPAKQTESQRRLLQLLETYDDNPGEVNEFIREQFPHLAAQHEQRSAVMQELVSQQRINAGGYMARRLRKYYKSRMRPRAGPNRFRWEHV